MYYTIYKVTNNINNKYYIGKHQTKKLEDHYMGSGTLLRRAIKKHGTENFTKEILYVFLTEQEMNDKEKELVVISKETYNLCGGGGATYGTVYYNNDGSRRYPKHYRAAKSNIKKARIKFLEKIKEPVFLQDFKEKTSTGLKNYYKKNKHSWIGKKHKISTKELIGQKSSIHQSGSGNSQYGTCWITNGQQNKKIKKNDIDTWISLGYYRGRIVNLKMK